MYKDVGKKILAAMLCICMLIGMGHVSNLSVNAQDKLAVTLSSRVGNYTGAVHNPEITVAYGDKILTQGEYSVQWMPHAPKEVGAYTITASYEADGTPMKATQTYWVHARDLVNAVSKDEISITFNQNMVPGVNVSVTENVLEIMDNGLGETPVKLNGIEETRYQALGSEAKAQYDYTYSITGAQVEEESGNIIISNPGTLTIAITGRNNYTNNAKELKYDVVVKGKPFGNVTYVAEQTYPVAENALNLQVWNEQGALLTEGTDYSVDYFRVKGETLEPITVNVQQAIQEAGSYAFTVSGKGIYKGSQQQGYFMVKKSLLDTANGIVISYPEEVVYTGEPIYPEVEISDNGRILVEGTDYSIIEYQNNVDYGYAQIYLKGEGAYDTGDLILCEFQIAKLSLANGEKVSVEFAGDSFIYNGNAQTPITAVKYDGKDITDQIEIEYADNVNAGTAIATIVPNKTASNMKDFFTVVFEIEPKSMDEVTITCDSESFTYNGSIQVPTLHVRDGGRDIASDNYEIRSQEAVGAGTYTIIVEGKNNYTGTREITYNINALSLEGVATVTVGREYVYTGKEIIPAYQDVEVVYKGETLKYGSDYIFRTVENNVDTTTNAVLIIEGVGNYKGTIKTKYVINPKPLNSMTGIGFADGIYAFLEEDELVYNGESQLPVVRISYNGRQLTAADFYAISVGARDVTADAEITIQGTRNYTGKITLSYAIVPKTFTESNLQVLVKQNGQNIIMENDNIDLPYIGAEQAVTPDIVQVSCDMGEMRNLLSSNYVVTYTNHMAIGQATMTIAGQGNYDGKVTKTYRIKGNIADAKVTDIKKTYTGSPIELTGSDLIATYTYNAEAPKQLEYKKDFIFVDYAENHTDVNSRVSVVMKAIGDYTGEKDVTFAILPKDISEPEDMSIAIADQIYTGKELTLDDIKDDITISYKENQLAVDTDYVISFADNEADRINCTPAEEKGVAVTIRAISANYTGVTTAYVKIVPRKLTANTLVTQKVTTPEGNDLVLVDQENIQLTLENITLRYEENGLVFDNDELTYEIINAPEKGYTDVGKNVVTIKGTDNFSGEVKIPFDIYGNIKQAVALGKATIRFNDKPYYTGNIIEPAVSIVYRGKELTAADFTVAYMGSDEAKTNVTPEGSGEVPGLKVTGKGNYVGVTTDEMSYYIQKCDLSKADNLTVFGLDAENIIYNKGPHYPLTGFANHDNPQLSITSDDNFVDNTLVKDKFIIQYFNNIEGASADLEDVSKRPTVTITATEDNPNYTGTLTAYFTIKGRDFSEYEVTVSPISDYTFNGSPIAPAVTGVTVKDADGEEMSLTKGIDYQVTYANNVNAGTKDDGEVAPTVIIKGINNFSGTITRNFTIYPKELDINSDDYIVRVSDGVYTGETIIPNVEIIDTSRVTLKQKMYGRTLKETILGDSVGVVLEQEKDYTVQAAINADNINAGKDNGAVNIIGTKNYTGTIDGEKFDIQPRAMSDDSINVLAIPDQLYQGTAIVPELTVALQGKLGTIVLEQDKDYIAKFKNNVDVGTATVEIVSNNPNLTGSRIEHFQIVTKSLAAATVVVEPIAPQIYQEDGVTPKPVIRDNGILLEENVDYTLTYQNNTMLGENIATVVITAVEGGNYIGSRTEVFSIVDDIGLAEADEIPVQPYTGNAIEPKPSLVKDGKPLTEGVDYTLSYENNVEGRTATIIVTGIKRYGGTKRITFEIGKDFSELVEAVGFAEKYTYTGEEIKPLPGKVTCEGYVLKEGVDYTLTYSNNINVGTGTVTINGMGCYWGSKTYEFNIIHRSMAQCTALPIENASYTGKKITPSVQVTYGTKTLAYGTDYTITYINNERPGTARVIINGKGNYVGNKVLTFKIKLDSVSGLAGVANSTKKVTLSWEKGTAVTGYEIYDSNNNRIARISNTKYIISGLKPATAYTYKVRAYAIKNGQIYYSSFTNVTVNTN